MNLACPYNNRFRMDAGSNDHCNFDRTAFLIILCHEDEPYRAKVKCIKDEVAGIPRKFLWSSTAFVFVVARPRVAKRRSSLNNTVKRERDF